MAFAYRFVIIIALAGGAGLLLGSCSSSSGSGNPCQGTGAAMSSGAADALTGVDADYPGWHFFLAGDTLCATHPEAPGDPVRIDSGVDTEPPFFTLLSADDPELEPLEITGLLYASSGHIRFVEAGTDAAVIPEPRQISSEDGADRICTARLARGDFETAPALIYGKADEQCPPDPFQWFQVSLTTDEELAPSPVFMLRDVVSPVYTDDGYIWEFDGWLALHGTQNSIIRLGEFGGQMGDALAGAESLAHLATFDDGTQLVMARTPGTTPQDNFYLYEPEEGPAEGTLTQIGDDNAAYALSEDADVNAPFTWTGDTFYFVDNTGLVEDENNPGELLEHPLLRQVNADGVETLAEGPSDYSGDFVIAFGGGFVAWGLNPDDSADPAIIEVGSPTDTFEEVFSEPGHVSAPIHGAMETYFFVNHATLSAAQDGEALVFDGPIDATTSYENAAWVGASHAIRYAPATGLPEITELFLVEDNQIAVEPGASPDATQELFVVDPNEPGTRYSLGELDQATFGPDVNMTPFAYGPHRLMRSAGDLIYANTRDQGSARTIKQGSEDPEPNLLFIDGF